MGGRYKHRVRVYGHSRQAQAQRVERLTWQLSSQAGQPLVGKPLGSNDEEVILVFPPTRPGSQKRLVVKEGYFEGARNEGASR